MRLGTEKLMRCERRSDCNDDVDLAGMQVFFLDNLHSLGHLFNVRIQELNDKD